MGSSSLRGRVKPSVPANKKDVFLVGHVFDVPFTVESFTSRDDTVPRRRGETNHARRDEQRSDNRGARRGLVRLWN